MAGPGDLIRIAAVADLHCSRTSQGALRSLFESMAAAADVLVLAGDLTDYGLPDEARVLAGELGGIRAPVVAVLGNHDHESGQADEVQRVLCDAGAVVLDGECVEIEGIGIAGAKGFAGGFGQWALPMWGEAATKAFAQEAMAEAIKLENALARLSATPRIALLHYSPIQATVEGEPPDIFAWMGSSRLEEPLQRYAVAAVIHGHAHAGSPEGRTSADVPVYNVAWPLLRRAFPDGPAFRLIELGRADPAEPPAPPEERGRGAAPRLPPQDVPGLASPISLGEG